MITIQQVDGTTEESIAETPKKTTFVKTPEAVRRDVQLAKWAVIIANVLWLVFVFHIL